MSVIEFKVSKLENLSYTVSYAPLVLKLTNVGYETIRILNEFISDQFDPTRFTIWFTLKIEKIGFTLTEYSLTKLKEEGFPENLIINLKSLKEKKYSTQDIFISALETAIGKKQTAHYKSLVLKFLEKTDRVPMISDLSEGGKIAMRRTLKYISLEKGEKHSFEINIANFIKLSMGTYLVSLKYRNQYGEDCFKGEVSSNEIEINVNT